METFDFDELATLARKDPAAFEHKRRELIEELFASIEARNDDPHFVRRLRGLQFRIDMERERSRTSMRALLRIYSMMWDSFIELNDALQRLSKGRNPAYLLAAPSAQSAVSARIIPFNRPSD